MIVEIYHREKDKKGKIQEELVEKKIIINGKEIELKFTMPIFLKMEEEIVTLDDLYEFLRAKDRFNVRKIPELVSLMSERVVSAKEVLEGSDVATLKKLVDEINRTVSKAVFMKEKRYDEDSVQDEVLEEIEKKETGAD